MSALRPILKKYRALCVIAPFFKLLEVVFELMTPLVVASIIDVGIANGDMGHVAVMCLVLAALALAGLAVSFTAQWFSAKAAALFSRDAKDALLAHIQTFSLGQREKMGQATLVNRMTGDMNQVQSGVNMTLRLLLRSPFVVLGAAAMAFTVDVKAALVFVVVIPLLSLIICLVLKASVPRFRLAQKSSDTLLAKTREVFSGARALRAYNLQDRAREGFREENATLYRRQIKAGAASALTNPLTTFVVNMGIIVLIRYGAIRVGCGTLSQGEVVALYNYMAQILVELIKLAGLIQTMTKALASAKRVEAVFAMPGELVGGSVGSVPRDSSPALEFRNVTFSYGQGEAALKGVSFTLPRGGSLGVVGATGSGKSTLASLAAGLRNPTEGQVLVCGVDTRDYTVPALRSAVSICLQKARLFRGTIRGNMLLASPNATDGRVREALSDADALSFVEEKGLGSAVEAGGSNFSGGQRQRLSLARAILHKGEVLILDDSFSALDYATEARIRRNLSSNPAAKVIISQRAASVRNCDNILVLTNGEVSASGRHDELIESCSEYREIWLAQSAGGEK